MCLKDSLKDSRLVEESVTYTKTIKGFQVSDPPNFPLKINRNKSNKKNYEKAES